MVYLQFNFTSKGSIGCISKIETSLKNLAIKNLAINLNNKKANIEWEAKN